MCITSFKPTRFVWSVSRVLCVPLADQQTANGFLLLLVMTVTTRCGVHLNCIVAKPCPNSVTGYSGLSTSTKTPSCVLGTSLLFPCFQTRKTAKELHEAWKLQTVCGKCVVNKPDVDVEQLRRGGRRHGRGRGARGARRHGPVPQLGQAELALERPARACATPRRPGAAPRPARSPAASPRCP